MGLLDNIRMAFASLWANKMRAILTMLGIIIGIGSVIAIVTVGDSLTGSISDSMQSLGASNITVSLSQKSSDDSGGAVTMEGVSIRMFGPSRPADEDQLTDEMIAEYREAIGDKVAAVSITESLGSGADPNGKSFEATENNKTNTFYDVGVTPYDDEGSVAMFGSDVSYPVYIPLTTAQKLNGSAPGYQSFTVVGSSAGDNAQFLSDTESFFASYYTRNQSWTVGASSMESMMSTVTEMISTVQMAIAAIAAISLLVGGIGVMNIMMVSITERTREIGTRKALGAPGYAIRLQFITESVVICLIGGVIGIVLGVVLGAWGASLLGYAAQPSVLAVAASVGFSMAIGVFFGYYPASKAAKLDPIEALRYE